MPNEKRLIDANDITVKLAGNASHVLRNADGDDYAIGRARGIMDAVDLINKLPTVDAVEVVHGRWIHKGAWHIECSECNYILAHIGEAKNYCPYCGAKMDGGNEDG